jgi:hypothetical protein
MFGALGAPILFLAPWCLGGLFFFSLNSIAKAMAQGEA